MGFAAAMKEGAKRAAALMVDDYRLNWIVEARARTGRPHRIETAFEPVTPSHQQALLASDTDHMRKAAHSSKSGMTGFVIVDDGRPICVIHYADAARYDRHPTWPLAPGEMALMDVATERSHCEHGLATQLIVATTAMMQRDGAQRIVAFIWWNNAPSLRAFAKAGWVKTGFSVELRRAGRWRSWHIRLPFAARRIAGRHVRMARTAR